MKKRVFAALAALALCGQAFGQGDSQAKEEPQQLWFDALFDEQGRVSELAPVNEASQPKGLWAQLLPRLKQASIQPVKTADGKPATFRTGMRVTLAVKREASGAGSVRLAGMAMLPVVLQEYAASYPADVGRNGGWEGEFTAVCTVGVAGRCVKVDVNAPAGMPDSVRRFARSSMEGWRFKPQEVNGQPIEGEYSWSVHMRTLDDMPKNFRDIRRL